MKKGMHSITAMAIVVFFSVFSLSACSSRSKPLQPPGQTATPQGQNLMGSNTQNMQGNLTGNNAGVNQQPQAQMQVYQQKAVNVKKQLDKMKEISQVNVMVIGDTAAVAYKPGSVPKDTNTVKRMIVTKVKEIDNSIKNVAVTEAQDMTAKINQLSNDLKGKRPMSDISRDFTQMIQKMNPVVK